MSLLDPVPPTPRRPRVTPVVFSLLAHLALGTLLLLAPALREGPMPQLPASSLPILYFDPPPPPPLPPIRGAEDGRRELRPREREVRPAEPERAEVADTFAVWRRQIEDSNPDPGDVHWGTPDGDDRGVPEGTMPGGDPNGVLGGTPGGVRGGVVGATGSGVVRDYDRRPVLVRRTQPVYPQEAFARRIQGTVLLEIVIGVMGRVEDVRVLQSVPGLDAAAIACVRQWLFEPARRRGQRVASVAQAPIAFTIH